MAMWRVLANRGRRMVVHIAITIADVNLVGWPRTEAGPPTANRRLQARKVSLKRSMYRVSQKKWYFVEKRP